MSSKPPTAKQLAYLRTLAGRTGQTFVSPQTRSQASAEILRLKNVRTNGFSFAEVTDEPAPKGRRDAASVKPWEIAGYGITATWRQRS